MQVPTFFFFRVYRGTLVLPIHLSCPLQVWSPSHQFQISLRLTLVAFSRPVRLSVQRPCQSVPPPPRAPCDRVAILTLCCQPASYITPSPSLGHVTSLTGDGCPPTKDSWVMVLILTSRKGQKSPVILNLCTVNQSRCGRKRKWRS